MSLLPLFITLFLCYNVAAQNPQWCCTGTMIPRQGGGFAGNVVQSLCSYGQQCSSYATNGSDTNATTYACGCPNGASCCTSSYCNCPSSAHKTPYQVALKAADLRSIMYPVLGMVFGFIWMVMAFLGPILPHTILVIAISLCNVIFGVFLLFNPVTVYVGLYFIVLGAFGIAVVRHHHSHRPFLTLALFSFFGCLFISALVVYVQATPLIEQLVYTITSGSPTLCEQSMDLYNYANNYFGVNLRCENYLLWLVFDLFWILCLQPILILAAYGLVHSDTLGPRTGTVQQTTTTTVVTNNANNVANTHN